MASIITSDRRLPSQRLKDLIREIDGCLLSMEHCRQVSAHCKEDTAGLARVSAAAHLASTAPALTQQCRRIFSEALDLGCDTEVEALVQPLADMDATVGALRALLEEARAAEPEVFKLEVKAKAEIKAVGVAKWRDLGVALGLWSADAEEDVLDEDDVNFLTKLAQETFPATYETMLGLTENRHGKGWSRAKLNNRLKAFRQAEMTKKTTKGEVITELGRKSIA